MLKKLVDTNIFIDRFGDPDLFQDLFLSDGLIYLSSVVLMELKAGAHSKEAVAAVHDLRSHFQRAGRIIVPSLRDFEVAGEVIAKLQSAKGYDIKKSASITNDCLMASSARNSGAVFYTQNKRDFQAILDVFNFRAVFL